MPLTLENPYAEPGTPFLKGNLHTHTTNSDGSRPPQEVIDDYAARGYDFLMISDHDKLIDPEPFKSHGMAMIPGNEISAKGPHLLHIDAHTHIPPDEDRQKILHQIAKDKAFAVINHPNWQEHFNHCAQEKLESWEGYLGIEIYNGVIRRLLGSPLATDRWDRLLAKGRRVWGFANDDSHRPEDVELAWNMVQAKKKTPKSVVEAMVAGAFYGSTGVEIETIACYGRTIHVATTNAQRIVVHSTSGKRETHVDAKEITFHVPEEAKYSYVRVECWGPGDAMAWTQPFFLKR
ncbi:MAG: CehA/McbA family metallohydrolase [Planctomycetota bacterium]|nr:CehA/McbA family metallohydrolase [Planctomycetota bacterium]